jgi:hypothetical protein
MKKKSERSGRALHDPDDVPEITQEWVDGANLCHGEKLIRRGTGASPPSVTEIRERVARRPAVMTRIPAAEVLRRERKRR